MSIWIVSHLSAKNYWNWWKFDEVLTKTNLLSFFWDTMYIAMVVWIQARHLTDSYIIYICIQLTGSLWHRSSLVYRVAAGLSDTRPCGWHYADLWAWVSGDSKTRRFKKICHVSAIGENQSAVICDLSIMTNVKRVCVHTERSTLFKHGVCMLHGCTYKCQKRSLKAVILHCESKKLGHFYLNRPTFDKVTVKIKVAQFFWLTV